jgi:hypothetical protein
MKALPIDNNHPWQLAELLFNEFYYLFDKVELLEKELKPLRTIPTSHNPTSKVPCHTQTKPRMADASCQTWEEGVMEIEPERGPQRRPVRCPFHYKSTYYTKVYVKKRIEREKMEVEVKKRDHITKHPRKIPKKPQKLVKVYVAKEVMQIETKKVEPGETPPRKARKSKAKEKRKKETPKEWAPQKKKRKKNTPGKDLGGPELNPSKNLTQPTKFSLITDFFSIMKKVTAEKNTPDPV